MHILSFISESKVIEYYNVERIVVLEMSRVDKIMLVINTVMFNENQDANIHNTVSYIVWIVFSKFLRFCVLSLELVED